MDDLTVKKSEQRKAALQARDALSDEVRAAGSREVCSRLTVLDEIQNAKVIFSYMPVGSELDIRDFNRAIAAAGKTLALPVSAKGGIMEAYAPEDMNALVPGLYGIPEPDVENAAYIRPEDIDAVIVPLVGFDDDFNRLGHGGGYYDRYLPLCGRAVKIGVGFEAQNIAGVAVDENDVPMDIIVTEA